MSLQNRGDRSLTAIVAKYIDEISFNQIPREVIDPIKDSIVDAVGCGIVGATSREVGMLVDYFGEMRSAEESVIWGTSLKAAAGLAAAANAAAVHAWDFDDTVLPGIVHPAGIMTTTGLSIAEKGKRPISGKELLTAIVAGYEISNLMSMALGGRKWRVFGFYNTVPVIFGAAAVAGKLLRLKRDALAQMLGIAATQASGLYSATMTKRLNAPKAVEGGILAAELARRGFEAPIDGIGDEQGFLKTFSRDPQWHVIPRDIGKYSFAVCHKIYPCIRSNHAAVYAASLLREEHYSQLNLAQIKKITVYADTLTKVYTVETPGGGSVVKTIGNALVSLPYCISAMLVHGRLSLEEFTEKSIKNAKVQKLLKKVEIKVDPRIDRMAGTKRYRATVKIEMNKGASYTKFCPAPKGDPANRMSKEEFYNKFVSNTHKTLSSAAIKQAYTLLEGIEKLGDVRKIPLLLITKKQ